MLESVCLRLGDHLSLLDSSTSLVEVTSDNAAPFYNMYVEGHTGKHLTGDRIRILLLNLPFVFRDLIAPEVVLPSTLYHKMADIMYDIISDFIYHIISDFLFHVLHCRFSLSTTPSVKLYPVQNCTVWPLSLTQVMKSSRSFWLHCGGICSSAVSVSMLWGWTNSMPYQWSCLKCSRKTCHTELAGQRVRISKRHTAFFTRCVIFCCLDGLRTSATRDLSMG
jgi:hypothetical protein